MNTYITTSITHGTSGWAVGMFVFSPKTKHKMNTNKKKSEMAVPLVRHFRKPRSRTTHKAPPLAGGRRVRMLCAHMKYVCASA